jgi:hypothetical protein
MIFLLTNIRKDAMLKKILVFMIAPILFSSPYAYSANLTDNFLAGKERDVGESLDWDIALKSPHAATVILSRHSNFYRT